MPLARSRPSTSKSIPANSLNLTIVPGWMVRVAPGGTRASPIICCTSVLVQTVPLGISPDHVASIRRSSNSSNMNRRRCNAERRLARWRARRSNRGIGLLSFCMVDGCEVMVGFHREGMIASCKKGNHFKLINFWPQCISPKWVNARFLLDLAIVPFASELTSLPQGYLLCAFVNRW